MPSRSPFQPDSNGAKIQVQIIMHHNQIINRISRFEEKISNKDPRLIHPGMRECHTQGVGGEMPCALVGQPGTMEGNFPSKGCLRDNHSSNIMSGFRVVLSRVSKADDEPQLLFLFLLGFTFFGRSFLRSCFSSFSLFFGGRSSFRSPFLSLPGQ